MTSPRLSPAPKGTRLLSGRKVHSSAAVLPAFTLLELLIVMSILALLISILLPAMSRSRKLSQRVVCQSKLGQLARGWRTYLDAHEGRFLQGANVQCNYGGKQGAIPPFQVAKPLNDQFRLDPIAQEGADVFACPSDSGGGPVIGRHADFYGTSYVTNMMLVGDIPYVFPPGDPCEDVLNSVNDQLPGLVESRATTDASRLILIGDFGWIYTANRLDTINRAEWHGERCTHNLAFLDGHVDFVRVRKGIYVSDRYAIIPFSGLLERASQCQQEIPCE